ncbi:MAG: DinB family protein [Bryobacteraceae bacterium]
MKTKICCLVMALMPMAAIAQESPAAPAPPPNPISASERGFYGLVSGEVVAAAEKMPKENYSFRPTPDVRTFGQLVGHVADAQYNFCGMVAGEQPSTKSIERTKTSKTDLVTALKDAVAYCNKVYAGMTDAQGSQMTKLMGYNLAKLTVLSVNTAHADEHYGNIVTYLRLKGIVPPSSEKPGNSGQK